MDSVGSANRLTNTSFCIKNVLHREGLFRPLINLLLKQYWDMTLLLGKWPPRQYLSKRQDPLSHIYRNTQHNSNYSGMYATPVFYSGTNEYLGTAVAQLVEALRYKSEGRGFDSRWCHWNFSLT